MSSAKKEFIERIVHAYPALSPKKRRVADVIMKDYKKTVFMTAKELARECKVSEPTIVRFATDLGFCGYTGFLDYMKGLLHAELTSVERHQSTLHRFEQGSILEKYCRNAIRNLENLINNFPVEDMKKVANILSDADTVYVAAYRASVTLAHHFGYLLKKVRSKVFVDTGLSWNLIDALNTAPENSVLFAIAFPRYPRKTVEVIEYARVCKVPVIGLSDNPRSPIITGADEHLIIDIEGVSFIDPFAHIITFLGALVHEVTSFDRERALTSLSDFDRGVKLANEFYSEESPYERFEYQLEGLQVTSLWPQKEFDRE